MDLLENKDWNKTSEIKNQSTCLPREYPENYPKITLQLLGPTTDFIFKEIPRQ